MYLLIYCFHILGQKEKEKHETEQDQLESVLEENKLSCPICSFSFLSKAALFQHASNYHGM